ncbi:MAG: LacI family transcriptional regulator [Cellulomonadaceae bacterium]|jgi:DNA-binding LacI/PurR family transcriptional regulator|nr:LacI family transcriptional regulator [Cellulomonadaceae bacterium]
MSLHQEKATGLTADPNLRQPSMADVAALAGVSHQTVSRVLNDHPNVRPATRDAVLDAIDQLGYRRSSAARALASGHSSTIGVLTANSTNVGPLHMAIAIGEAAQENGYYVSLAPAANFTPEETHRRLNQLVEQGVDGIIAIVPHNEVALAVDSYSFPCPVVISAARPDIPANSPGKYVYVDHGKGTQLAVDYLLELGHAKIWHIAGPENWIDATVRRDAYTAIMTKAGLTPVVLTAQGWTSQQGYEVGKEIAAAIKAGTGPTAVYAVNDDIAIGLYRALWEAGLAVPDDVSIVGFDDVEAAAFIVPSLTTLRQPFAEAGRACIEALVDEIGGQSDPQPRIAAVLEPALVIRDSARSPAPH